jgi:hypothetical protein
VTEGPQRREDLVATTSHNLPAWADGKPHTYFAAAERYEGVDRVAFTEWKITLPRELSHRENLALAHDLLDASFGTTHPYTYAFHDPAASDGDRQPHIHVLWSARTLDGIDRQPTQFFKRWNAHHPERGGARKDPALNHLGAVFAARQMLCDITNVHLEQHGHAARLDPRQAMLFTLSQHLLGTPLPTRRPLEVMLIAPLKDEFRLHPLRVFLQIGDAVR